MGVIATSQLHGWLSDKARREGHVSAIAGDVLDIRQERQQETVMEALGEPTLAHMRAEVDAAIQARDRLHAEVTHLLEVLTVWRMDRDRLRAEDDKLREEQRRLTGPAPHGCGRACTAISAAVRARAKMSSSSIAPTKGRS